MLAYFKALPRFILWIYAFFFGGVIYLSDRLAMVLLRTARKSEYVRRGGCQNTGMCCRSLAIEIPRSWARRSWLVRGLRGWYRSGFNFHSLGTLHGNWLVFECHHLRPDNRCGIYPYRPKLCREFPVTPLFGHGRLHKGCGFWFAKRSELGTFQEALLAKQHDRERRDYLNQGPEKILFEHREALRQDSVSQNPTS